METLLEQRIQEFEKSNGHVATEAPPQDTRSPGQSLYELFRRIADNHNVATFSWWGMSDGYRNAWSQLATHLMKKKAS